MLWIFTNSLFLSNNLWSFPSNSCSELDMFSRIFYYYPTRDHSGLLRHKAMSKCLYFYLRQIIPDFFFFAAMRLKIMLKILNDLCFNRGDMFV